MLSFSSHWLVKNGCHQDDAFPFPEANHCYCPSSTLPCRAVIWFPFCLLVWRADLRFMCATVSGTLLVTWTTAGMKRMLQHLQQAVNKGSISKVNYMNYSIIYLRSLKIFHHNFPLPSSLLKIRKKASLSPNPFLSQKMYSNKPSDFIENTGNLANDLGVCQWCAICFENVRPNSEPLRTWGTRRAGFFSFRPWEVGCLLNPFPVVNDSFCEVEMDESWSEWIWLEILEIIFVWGE